jgi:hypothetical protein
MLKGKCLINAYLKRGSKAINIIFTWIGKS